ncbi:MAG: NAD(P)-dependent oxidoreductase [Synechococcus sp.]|nr:NAD(P)-dependent oxidoreductase [Synechococcus sp.]
MTRIALLGTGLLGEAIGQRLLSRGVKLGVWNRNEERCQQLVNAGATVISNLDGAGADWDAVITVLRDGPVTQEVVAELGDLQGGCLMPMGTMGITEIRSLAQQVQHQNGTCLEAPVLGSKPQAADGTLLVMAGGTLELFEQQRPLLEHLSQQPMLVGPIGSGAATKLALNQLIASLTHAFSLSLRLVQQAGVPVETFMAILRPSALYAPTFDKKLQRMLDGHYADPNFSTALLRKDLRLFLEEATAAGLQVSGLGGLDSLLGQPSGGELDALDYCALHELTLQTDPPHG